MQYSININQVAAHNYSEELDLKDMSIIYFLRHFFSSKSAKKHSINFDGDEYYWISYGKLIEEMPLVKIKSQRVMKARVDKLIRLKLFTRHPDCVKLNKSFIAFTENIELLFSQKTTYTPKSVQVKKDPAYTPKHVEVDPNLYTQTCRATYTPKHVEYHNTLKDQITSIDHNTIETPNGVFPKKEIQINDFEKEEIGDGREVFDQEAINDFLEAEKEEKKKVAPKKKSWEKGANVKAREIWDRSYREWTKAKGLPVTPGEGVYWDGKEIGQLKQFLNRLWDKSQKAGQVYENDFYFLESACSVFLNAASKLTGAWYLDAFIPSKCTGHFDELYLDVKKHYQNGYNGSKQNGRTGNRVTDAQRAAAEALLD